jgi:hypothetical protein
MDLIQRAIKDGRLKFEAAKAPMKVDADPLAVEANMVEPEAFKTNMVNVSRPNAYLNSRYRIEQFDSFYKEIYPYKGEPLIDFLWRNKEEGNNIALCPRCSDGFDQDAAETFERHQVKSSLIRWPKNTYMSRNKGILIPKEKER